MKTNNNKVNIYHDVYAVAYTSYQFCRMKQTYGKKMFKLVQDQPRGLAVKASGY